MGSATPPTAREAVALLNQLRQACQDLAGRSIRASAESGQWRTRLAGTHGPTITAELTLAYHLRAGQDAAYWQRLRHQWACRYATTAAETLRAILAAPPGAEPSPDANGTGGRTSATATTATCPTLPDPSDLTTGSPTWDTRIAQTHQAVTEAADAAALAAELVAPADMPPEITRAAGQLTGRILAYATAVHAAARALSNIPGPPADE